MMLDRRTGWALEQWAQTVAAISRTGAIRQAGRRAAWLHAHRDAMRLIFGRSTDLAKLSAGDLEERAREVGLDPEHIHPCFLRAFTARLEIERELRVEGLC